MFVGGREEEAPKWLVSDMGNSGWRMRLDDDAEEAGLEAATAAAVVVDEETDAGTAVVLLLFS